MTFKNPSETPIDLMSLSEGTEFIGSRPNSEDPSWYWCLAAGFNRVYPATKRAVYFLHPDRTTGATQWMGPEDITIAFLVPPAKKVQFMPKTPIIDFMSLPDGTHFIGRFSEYPETLLHFIAEEHHDDPALDLRHLARVDAQDKSESYGYQDSYGVKIIAVLPSTDIPQEDSVPDTNGPASSNPSPSTKDILSLAIGTEFLGSYQDGYPYTASSFELTGVQEQSDRIFVRLKSLTSVFADITAEATSVIVHKVINRNDRGDISLDVSGLPLGTLISADLGISKSTSLVQTYQIVGGDDEDDSILLESANRPSGLSQGIFSVDKGDIILKQIISMPIQTSSPETVESPYKPLHILDFSPGTKLLVTIPIVGSSMEKTTQKEMTLERIQEVCNNVHNETRIYFKEKPGRYYLLEEVTVDAVLSIQEVLHPPGEDSPTPATDVSYSEDELETMDRMFSLGSSGYEESAPWVAEMHGFTHEEGSPQSQEEQNEGWAKQKDPMPPKFVSSEGSPNLLFKIKEIKDLAKEQGLQVEVTFF